MASPTQWTWLWVNSGSWWWTGRPGVLRFMGSQRVGHDWATELNWTWVRTQTALQSEVIQGGRPWSLPTQSFSFLLSNRTPILYPPLGMKWGYVKASLGNPTRLYLDPVWGRCVIQSWKMKQKWKCSGRYLRRILLWKPTTEYTCLPSRLPSLGHSYVLWHTFESLAVPFKHDWKTEQLTVMLAQPSVTVGLAHWPQKYPPPVSLMCDKHILVQAINCVFWYLLPKYPDSFRL